MSTPVPRTYRPPLTRDEIELLRVNRQGSGERIVAQSADQDDETRYRRCTSWITDRWSQGARLYALGHNIEEVFEMWRGIPPLALELFQHREEFSYTFAQGGQPAVTINDYGTTNSRRNLDYVCLCLSVGDLKIAREVANLAWDPPDADYVSMNSSICRPYDQALAGCLRQILHGRNSDAQAELKKCRPHPSSARPNEMKRMLSGLLNRDIADFLDGLENLTDWYSHTRTREGSYDLWLTTDSLLSHWGLGLAVLAIYAHLVTVEDLRVDTRVPIHMISLALQPLRE